MASNVIGIIKLFISILFKYNTYSRNNFHQTINRYLISITILDVSVIHTLELLERQYSIFYYLLESEL